MNIRNPTQCETDRQEIYNGVANRITEARVAVSKLISEHQNYLKGLKLGEDIDTILEKAGREAADRAILKAENAVTYRDLREEVTTLRKALEKYAHCRHGVTNDNCTQEARAALYPYLVKEQPAR